MYMKQCNRMKMSFKKCVDGENFVDLVVMETFVSICFRKSLTVVSTIVVEIFILYLLNFVVNYLQVEYI